MKILYYRKSLRNAFLELYSQRTNLILNSINSFFLQYLVSTIDSQKSQLCSKYVLLIYEQLFNISFPLTHSRRMSVRFIVSWLLKIARTLIGHPILTSYFLIQRHKAYFLSQGHTANTGQSWE